MRHMRKERQRETERDRERQREREGEREGEREREREREREILAPTTHALPFTEIASPYPGSKLALLRRRKGPKFVGPRFIFLKTYPGVGNSI